MDPLVLAKDLAESILASQQYREFVRVKEAMYASEEASNSLRKLREQQQVLRNAELQESNILEGQMDEIAPNPLKMFDNPEISAYFTAKKNLEELLAAINETIASITGMETGRGHGHAGGGCGCACR